MAIISMPFTRRKMLMNAFKLAGATMVCPRCTWASTNEDDEQARHSPLLTRHSVKGYAPKLSVEGYVWTQHFAALKETLAAGEEEALRATHQAGYSRIELSSDFFKPEVRQQTGKLLAQYQLKPETVYAGTTLHEASAAETSVQTVVELAKFLKPLGTKVIITNPSPKPHQERKSDEELSTQARYINRLGAALRPLGMRLLLHHHTPELRENAREWWYELQQTEPELAGCCVDVHWAYRGGQEVMPFLRKVGDRLGELHLRNSQQGVWMEDFGPGDVDYAPVAAYVRETQFQGYLIVELAYEKGTTITRSLEEDLRLSRIYTQKVFGPGIF
jgi:inosose dehydratase